VRALEDHAVACERLMSMTEVSRVQQLMKDGDTVVSMMVSLQGAGCGRLAGISKQIEIENEDFEVLVFYFLRPERMQTRTFMNIAAQ